MEDLALLLADKGFLKPEIVGDGSSATVLVAYSEKEGCDVALKIFNKKDEDFLAEDNILKKIEDKRIIKRYRTLQDSLFRCGIIVLQLMDHDLMDTLEVSSKLSENEARRIFYEICRATLFCHKQNIAHLDIKPENILLDNYERTVVLSDFGTAIHFEPGVSQIIEPVGTFFYCAPEITHGRNCYPDKADVWSLGILLHVLLTGTWPYAGKNMDEAYDNALDGKITLLKHKMSKFAGELIDKMLVIDATKRCNIVDVLNHPWIRSIDRSKSEKEHITVFNLKQQVPIHGCTFTSNLTSDSPRRFTINKNCPISQRVADLNSRKAGWKFMSLDENLLTKPPPKGLKTPRHTSTLQCSIQGSDSDDSESDESEEQDEIKQVHWGKRTM